jgi:hypothetical protein
MQTQFAPIRGCAIAATAARTSSHTPFPAAEEVALLILLPRYALVSRKSTCILFLIKKQTIFLPKMALI